MLEVKVITVLEGGNFTMCRKSLSSLLVLYNVCVCVYILYIYIIYIYISPSGHYLLFIFV